MAGPGKNIDVQAADQVRVVVIWADTAASASCAIRDRRAFLRETEQYIQAPGQGG